MFSQYMKPSGPRVPFPEEHTQSVWDRLDYSYRGRLNIGDYQSAGQNMRPSGNYPSVRMHPGGSYPSEKMCQVDSIRLTFIRVNSIRVNSIRVTSIRVDSIRVRSCARVEISCIWKVEKNGVLSHQVLQQLSREKARRKWMPTHLSWAPKHSPYDSRLCIAIRLSQYLLSRQSTRPMTMKQAPAR